MLRPQAATTLRPGQLFIAEDFALCELGAPEIWDRMISIAVREQASDLHLTYQSEGMRIGVRLDGRMHDQGVLPAEVGQRVTNHVKVLSRMELSERRKPQDGRLTLDIDGRPIDLRISLLPTSHGEDIAVRVLDRESSLLSVDRLGVSGCQLGEIDALINAPSGLILVTGSTGAGKSTTLYALLQRLTDGSRKCVTIEDPIEYDLPGVNQAQVNHKIGVDWSMLMRSVLRHDPNVIMLGEIRDPETASAAVRAANSGRLVLATSHASYSAAAVESLTALGAHPHFVARALRGVIAQTLVRRLCPYCTIRLEETSDFALLEDVQHLLNPDERPALSMGRGCPHCRHTGYRSRLGVFEIMTADDRTREMVAHNRPAREVYSHAVESGMVTIAQAGKLSALRGLTTVEELLNNVSEIWTGGA
ncbi:MAG: type II/IV secretion system protein [Phycisphaerales bacterium]|nr:type II/IV secretion system protein [Phycisphaerales bacterium]